MLRGNMQHTDNDKLNLCYQFHFFVCVCVDTGIKFLLADCVTVLILIKNAAVS